MKKINVKSLIVCLLLPLAVGGLAALLTANSMSIFEIVKKPPLSPPNILFPIVWTVLYILMGIAAYIVLHADHGNVTGALKLYGWQLAVNFLWPLLFFNFQRYFVAFIWLMLLWALVLWTTVRFWKITPVAGTLILPYLLWVTFAAYLNFGIYWLNRTAL